jgi:hypothetical protein
MFGLQAVINVPTRIYKETNSAIGQIILNPELWGFKTEVFETTLSDHFGQILQIEHDLLPGKKFKQTEAIYKYIRVTNDENIKYLNYLLSGENWENVYQQHDIDIAYKEFLQILTYYFDTAIPFRKVNINKQIKNQWITPGICKSSERLKILSTYIKERNVSTEFVNYYNNYKKIYHKVINLAKKCIMTNKYQNKSINKKMGLNKR